MEKDKKERKIWEVLSLITPSDLTRLPDDYSYYGRNEKIEDIFGEKPTTGTEKKSSKTSAK